MISETRRAELLALATECRELVDCVMASAEKPSGPPSSQNLLKRAVAMLTAKACDTFDGLLLLAGHGLIGEAFVLYRVLLETFANTEFIIKHGDAGTFLFWEGTVVHLRKLRKMLEQGHMKDHWSEADTCEGIRRLGTECREIEDALPSAFGGLPAGDALWAEGTTKRRLTWEGIRVSGRFERAGLKPLYETVYSIASQHVHADPAIQRSYFDPPGSQDPLVDPKMRYFEDVVIWACLALIAQAGALDKAFAVGLDKHVNSYFARVRASARKNRQTR